MTETLRIVLADPGQQVPDYDRALAAGLAGLGHRVRLAVAPLLYYTPPAPAAGVDLELAFGRLLAGREGPRRGLAGRPLVRRVLRLAGYPFELTSFVRRLEVERPAVLHLQWSLVPPLEAIAWRRLRAAGVPVLLTAHNVLPHEPRPWQPPAYRTLYRAVDALIVHSEASRRRLLALTGLAPHRITVLPMAADTPTGPLPDRPAARRVLGLATEAPLVLFFGHVRPYKGLDDLLDALPIVRATLPTVRLLVAGPVAGGPRALAALRRRLASTGLAQAVDLWPGHVPAERVDLVFAAADVLALPYRATDDSAVLQAARGRRRAVVASAVGGLPEALAGGGGLLVPPGDPPALAEALSAILGDKASRRRLEDEAGRAAAARTWADVAAETVGLYRTLDASRRGAGEDRPAWSTLAGGR